MFLDLLLILAVLIVPLLVEGALIFGIFRMRKSYARKGFGCLALLVLPVVLCTTTLTIPSLYNQVRLIRFAQQLYGYPLPPDTSEISRDARIFVGGGSADKCWYHARRTVYTTLPEEDIKAYYEDVLFDGVGDSSTVLAIADLDGKLTAAVNFDESDDRIAVIGIVDGPYYGSFITIDPRCFQ